MNLSEWKKVALGEVVDINSSSLTNSTEPNFEFKYIDLSSVEKGKVFFPDFSIKFIDAPSRARRVFRENDILMSTVRPNLQAFAYVDFSSENYIASTGFAILRASNKVNPKFLYQNLYSQNVSSQINGMLVGSNYPAINNSDVASIIIPLPPLAEQEKIAEVLGCWDEGIEKIEKIISLKEQQKKGLMQKLLTGKTRLKGCSKPWKEVKLGNLGETFTGLTGKTKEDFGIGYPFITYMNIFSSCKITKNKMDLVDIKTNENQNEVKYGDIFFTTSSETPYEVGMSSVLLFEPKEKTYLNSFCFGFRLHNFNTLTPNFASFFFRSVSIREKLNKLAQGATRYNLSKTSLFKMKIFIPTDVSEQSAITEILTSADREIELLKQKLGLFKQQKKYLMQQLLTGKKRLKIN